MASAYTPHYNLDKYVGTDKPNLRDQYNAAMDKIDTELWSQHSDVADAKAMATEVTAKLGDGFTSVNTVTMQMANKANSSDVSTLRTSVSTLQTSVSNEITARQNADNALDQRITDLENYKPIILLFGDSYCITGVGDGRGNIYEQLEARLGGKYRIINKSVGGAAFADVGDAQAPYILQQVNAAIADTSFDHSEVAFCIVVGGRNDGYRGTQEQSRVGVSNCGNALRNEFTNAKVVFGIGNWTGQKLSAIAASKFHVMEAQAKNIAGCVSTSGLWSALLTGDDSLAPASTNYHPIPTGMWRITNLLIAACFGGSASPTFRTAITNPFNGCTDMTVDINGNLVTYVFTLTTNANMTSPISLSNEANRFFGAQPHYMSANSVNAGNAPCTLRFNADGTVQSFPAGATVVTGVPYNVTQLLCQ